LRISILLLRARLRASEVIASTTSEGMVGMDGDSGADEMFGLADVTLEVVGMLRREGVGGLVDLPRLETTFERIVRNLDIVFVS
jgi:hypothetical protein